MTKDMTIPEERGLLIPDEDTSIGRFLDEETGEIIEVPAGKQNAAWFAYQHFWANLQQKGWEKRKAIFGRLIQREQDAPKAAYLDPDEGHAIVSAIKQSNYPVFHASGFAGDISDLLSTDDGVPNELGADELLSLLLASKGFSLDKLAKGSRMRKLVEKHTEKRPKSPWVETEVRLELPGGR
jgi:hypothetical protein